MDREDRTAIVVRTAQKRAYLKLLSGLFKAFELRLDLLTQRWVFVGHQREFFEIRTTRDDLPQRLDDFAKIFKFLHDPLGSLG